MGWPAPPSAIWNTIAEFVRAQEERTDGVEALAIYMGKNVCSIVGLGAEGQVVVRRRTRRELAAFTRKWSSSVVAMEACCGAHHLGRVLAALAGC